MIISVVNLMRSTVTWEMSLWPHLGVIILICSIVGGTIHWVWTLGCAKAENEVFISLCFFFMVSGWPAVFFHNDTLRYQTVSQNKSFITKFSLSGSFIRAPGKESKTHTKKQLRGWFQGFKITTKCKNGLREEITIWNKILNKDIGNMHILKFKQQTNHW